MSSTVRPPPLFNFLTNSRCSLDSWSSWLRPTLRSSWHTPRQPPTPSYLDIPTSSPQSGWRSSLSIALKKTQLHLIGILSSLMPSPCFPKAEGRNKEFVRLHKAVLICPHFRRYGVACCSIGGGAQIKGFEHQHNT